MLIARFFILAAPMLLAGCGDWERDSAFPSPDGKLIAVVEYMGSGACCSDHSRIRLENADGGNLAQSVIIAEVTRATARPHWSSNDKLVIEACAAPEMKAQTRILREPVVLADGSTNAVNVNVVTAPMSNLDGKSYCVTSTEGA